MAKIKRFLDTLANNQKLKKVLFVFVCAFVFFYVFSVPSFSGRERYNLISYFAIGALFGFSLLHILIYRNFRFDKRTLILPTFILFAFIGTPISSHEFRDYLTLVLLTITFYVLLISFSIIDNSDLFLMLIVFALLSFSIYFIIHYRNELMHFSEYVPESAESRLGWDFDNPNAVGMFMNIGVSASLYLSLFGKKKINLLFLLATVIFFFIGITTGSRTFIVSSAIAIVALLFFKFRKHWLIFLIILGVLVATFIILLNTPYLATIK